LKKIIVIGAGAAGLMAAYSAAKAGANVILLERKKRVGSKIRISGKGRCNITNSADLPAFIERFGRNGKFLREVFNTYFTQDLLAFFKEYGLETKIERGGRIFPVSDQAHHVAEALETAVKQAGVSILFETYVEKILFENQILSGVKIQSTRRSNIIKADAIIIATGGLSYPATGSSGDGYTFAESLGHKIVNLRPALIPLETAEHIDRELWNLTLKNVSLTVLINEKKKAEAFGEIMFTPTGLGGPVVITLSGMIVDALDKKKKIIIDIDLKPALPENKLEARLIRDLSNQGKVPFVSILNGLLPGQLVNTCARELNISLDKLASQVSAQERKQLRLWLKNVRFHITGYRPIAEAIVTAGGVSLKEINPLSLASKKIQGLYFAGEVMDIQADTGGYNLQAAFSTGWVAGLAASGGQNPF
jgi:predicted Rossmann fold flavoprotein